MGCIGPTGGRNGDKVMTEVHKHIKVLPVVETVTFCLRNTLNKPSNKQKTSRILLKIIKEKVNTGNHSNKNCGLLETYSSFGQY